MRQKHPPCPHRIRRVAKQFGWVDHRLVRGRHIEACSHAAAALYLFLITVADARGLSYYADASIEKSMSMDHHTLCQARDQLIKNALIAYKRLFYQVLPLDPPPPPVQKRPACDQARSFGQIFKKIMEEAS
nr:hypothetical protein [Desulfosalsimonas propionicica]